ncbi:MAG: esterase-like activity of phytase family protein [Archangium sp.]|nr:esterase-like activity of phytase family protein [Archangium sp.]
MNTLVIALLLAADVGTASVEWKSIEVTSTPVGLLPDGGVKLDALAFKGAVELTSTAETFGGLSGLRMWNGKLYAVADKRGTLFRFAPTHDAKGNLTGVSGAEATSLDIGDAEALEFANGAMWVSNEDSTTISSFAVTKDQISSSATRAAMPTEGWNLARNKGFEAIAISKDCALMFSELSGMGFIGKPDAIFTAPPNLSALAWPPDFSPTDVHWVTPGKSALVVLRKFDGKAYGGIARVTMSGCSPKDFKLQVLTTWGEPVLVDNYEALVVVPGAKTDTLFVLSDDNFKSKGPQHTYLLEFSLAH